MKILILSPHFPSPAMPMRGLSSNTMLAGFRQRGHDVRVVVPVPWAPPWVPKESFVQRRAIPANEVDHGTVIAHPRYLAPRRLGVRAQRSFFWRGVRQEVERFVGAGGDIIHAHSVGLPSVVLGRTGATKVVVSMQDHELYDVVPRRDGWHDVIARGLRGADTVVYVSETLKARGIDLVGPHATQVIPWAIDVYPDVVHQPPDVFTVVTAARLIERKKVHLLVRAVAEMNAASETHLVVVGDGPERANLEALVRALGIEDCVSFSGERSHREVVEIMARGHVFALPSVREALGTVYFEAMTLGVPVVGVLGEGIGDYVTDGADGFLVPPGDVPSLVRILDSLRRDSNLRARVGRAGRVLFEQTKVTWEDYVIAHVELYGSLCGVE